MPPPKKQRNIFRPRPFARPLRALQGCGSSLLLCSNVRAAFCSAATSTSLCWLASWGPRSPPGLRPQDSGAQGRGPPRPRGPQGPEPPRPGGPQGSENPETRGTPGPRSGASGLGPKICSALGSIASCSQHHNIVPAGAPRGALGNQDLRVPRTSGSPCCCTGGPWC